MTAISIPLSQGKTTLIDAGDLPLLEGRKWHAVWNGWHWYAASTEPITGRRVYLHRLLTKAGDGEEVDHINGDTLDNRRSVNLRTCARHENGRNRSRQSNNTSGFIGVYCYPKRRLPFRASIWIKSQCKHVGWFATAEEAAQARDRAACQHYGEFAVLNFPEAVPS